MTPNTVVATLALPQALRSRPTAILSLRSCRTYHSRAKNVVESQGQSVKCQSGQCSILPPPPPPPPPPHFLHYKVHILIVIVVEIFRFVSELCAAYIDE